MRWRRSSTTARRSPSTTGSPAASWTPRGSRSTIRNGRSTAGSSASGDRRPAMNDSELGRLLGVLVSPGKTFRSIAARPTTLALLLVIVLSTLGVSLLAAPKTDYEDIMRGQLAKSGREIPQEQLDKQIQMMKKIRTPLTVAGAIVLPLG